MNAPPPPDLVASAAREARNMFLLGVAALPFGALVTAFGAVAPCFLIFGPLLILGGLVAAPFGLYQWFNPTSHSSIRRLGPTPEARAQAVDEIERELRLPDAETYALAGSDHLVSTPHWLVRHGSTLAVVATRDVLWAYKLVTTRKRYGITVSTTVQVVVQTRHDKIELPATEKNTPEILGFVQRAAPAAFIGYDAARDSLPVARLAQLVDERRTTVIAPARPASGAAPTSSPVPLLNEPVATAKGRPSAMFFVVGGLVLLVLVCGCGALCAGAAFMAEKEKAAVADLAPACQGMAVADAAVEAPGRLAHVVVFEKGSAGWEPAIGSITGVLKGETTASTGFVLCLEPATTVQAESCDYEGGLSVTRERSMQVGRLVSASTGLVLGTRETYGPMPDACPEEISSSRTISASDVSLDDWAPAVLELLGG